MRIDERTVASLPFLHSATWAAQRPVPAERRERASRRLSGHGDRGRCSRPVHACKPEWARGHGGGGTTVGTRNRRSYTVPRDVRAAIRPRVRHRGVNRLKVVSRCQLGRATERGGGRGPGQSTDNARPRSCYVGLRQQTERLWRSVSRSIERWHTNCPIHGQSNVPPGLDTATTRNSSCRASSPYLLQMEGDPICRMGWGSYNLGLPPKTCGTVWLVNATKESCPPNTDPCINIRATNVASFDSHPGDSGAVVYSPATGSMPKTSYGTHVHSDKDNSPPPPESQGQRRGWYSPWDRDEDVLYNNFGMNLFPCLEAGC